MIVVLGFFFPHISAAPTAPWQVHGRRDDLTAECFRHAQFGLDPGRAQRGGCDQDQAFCWLFSFSHAIPGISIWEKPGQIERAGLGVVFAQRRTISRTLSPRNDSRPGTLKLHIAAESNRIPENSGDRDQDATLTNAPNSGEFGYAQLQRPGTGKLSVGLVHAG